MQQGQASLDTLGTTQWLRLSSLRVIQEQMASRTRHTSMHCPSFLTERLSHVPRHLKAPTPIQINPAKCLKFEDKTLWPRESCHIFWIIGDDALIFILRLSARKLKKKQVTQALRVSDFSCSQVTEFYFIIEFCKSVNVWTLFIKIYNIIPPPQLYSVYHLNLPIKLLRVIPLYCPVNTLSE